MRLKRTISAFAALAIMAGCFTAVPVSAASTDPVIRVTFDDGSDAYTLNGTAALADGRSGKALSLDGSDGAYAAINSAASKLHAISGDFTISVWFNPSEIQWWQRVFDLGTGTSAYTFLSLGNPRFAIMNGTEQNFDSNTALTAGVWQNVTISRSGNETKFWLDGFETGSTTGINYKFSDLAAFTQCYLGKSQYSDPYFKGMIDDFTVYDRALSVSEIQTLAAEAYTAKRDAKVAENNCYVADTKFYSGSNEIFSYNNESSVKAVVNVENDTMTAGSVTAKLVAAVGSTETELASSQVTLQPAENTDITLTSSSVPSGADKLIVKLTAGEDTYTAATLYSGLTAPVAAPADSDTTTNGAHDPSIVKFPNDDTYYVYSSHHLLFTSKDLINWRKYDFTNINAATMSPKTAAFISAKFPAKLDDGTANTMNGTYWAPDVIYRPDDTEHPYWMYISVSCGLGGMYSVISLVKSDNPLFWADSNSKITDCGPVFASNWKAKTNAIDANIYYDSADNNKAYFLWGSFWGGIQAAELTDDGFVKGVDYTSNDTIYNSCTSLGTSVFTQKRGVAGPEGGWMIEHGDYRYLFTSYAWLGSNYHTRVARSPLSAKFSANTGTQLLDANNVVMGTQYSSSTGEVTKAQITGYKLIGSYRLGDGSTSLTENDVNSWYYPRESGDAHVYYGPGHNSVINIGNNTFYVSHTRKDMVEGAATLQVRKVLFTSDGWPVVSPVTYAGEVEQVLPAEMIKGTYDLASVGVTKFAPGTNAIDENFDNHSGNRNYDLPVISSKVTLGGDNKVTNKGGAQIGTWAFDNDHTVTITFTENGDNSVDEFYKSGDVMTLYALYGYDKDEAEPVIALTGTDQNHITQFAKKSTQIFKTPSATIKSDPVTVAKSAGGNPELGFDKDGNILYAGDPAATVIGDTVYLICGHDTSEDEAYKMPEWVLYTSKNMTDWEYKGSVMKATDISWRNTATDAWASQMVEYGGKYYLYFCTWDKTSEGKMSIGVAVANSPEGPYTDKGTPIVKGTFTAPESSGWNDIDPTVLIDTVDGVEHRYLAWGNGKYYICELNEDMTSVKDIDGDGQIIMHKDIKERPVKSMGGGVYTEAPWLYKRDGKYYMFYAMNWREEMAYAMADDPMGRYDFKQIIMPPTATSNTNHPSVIDFNGKTYFIYHNGALPHGSGFRRSVCIDELKFDENGYVYPVTETSIGLTGTASVIKSSSNKYIGHSQFTNSLADSAYPISAALTAESAENGYNTAWEIMPAKAVPGSESANSYVSLQSVNKPGLYITSTGSGVTLTQDTMGTSGSAMTFKTVKGLDGNENTVSFESVSDAGKYLTVLGSGMTLSYGVTPADCSFVISGATAKDPSVISVAAVEPEPAPEAAITQNFDALSTGTLISLGYTDDKIPYTDIKGMTLYITKATGRNDPNQNFNISSGGVSGNALVLKAGNFQSASRGPRMAIYTPVIPNGYTATAEIKVKQGTAGSVLRYNDSTTAEAGTDITGLSTDWQTFKVTITNDNDTYTRCMYLGDTKLNEDYIGSFPVLWGTTSNSTGQSIYFDDLTIKTTDTNGETPIITVPDPAAWFRFDNDLKDSIGDGAGTLTGSTAGAAATATAAAYVEGKSGKAVLFTGADSYGVELPVKPSGSNYTISFDAKINASATFSPFIFMANYANGALKGGDDNAQWVSIAPQGWQETLTSGPMVWSRNVPGGAAWNDLYKANNNSVTTGKWHNITVAAKGAEAKLYVDKELVAAGPIADIVDSTTIMYLGVNAWDTPFNGAIDNLMLFNETLSADQVALIDTVGAAARIGDTAYAAIDEALEAAKDGDTIELLSDVTATIACPKAVTINGHGYKYTFAPTAEWQLALGTTEGNKKVVINNATVSIDYAANDHVDFARGGTTAVELNNVTYDNVRPAWSVMVDAVDMKNSKINGFQGFTVIANWIGDSISITNSEIKDAKVGNGTGAVLLGINGEKNNLNAVITDSTITGTKDYAGNAAMPDVCLGSGTLTLKGSTVIGELKKTGGALTLDKSFKGNVKVTGLTIAGGTEVAAVNDGADVSGVTVSGMTEEFMLKTENGKLVIAAAPAEPTPAPISGKVDEGAETNYATLQELVNAAGTETETTVTVTGEAADQGTVTVPENVTLKVDGNASLKNTVINAEAGKPATVEIVNEDKTTSTITADSVVFGANGKATPSDGAVISTPSKTEPGKTDKGFVKTKELANESSVTFIINEKEYTAELSGNISGDAVFCVFVTGIPEGEKVTVELD